MNKKVYKVIAGSMLLIILMTIMACSGSPQTTASETPPAATIQLPGSTSFRPEGNLPLAPELRKEVLGNGLTTYLRYNGNPGRRVTLYLVVAAGSADESEDQLGYAHFIEHMAFNGTTTYPKNELVNYLRSIGMRFGAEINAYTSRENTVYKLEIPTDTPVFLERGLQVLKEWATDITFDPTEVEKEKGVILEERRSRLGPEEQAMANELPVLLGDSRHAYRDPIGTEASIRNATAESLRAFYEQHYRPERMAVIMVGDIVLKDAGKMLRQTFSFPAAEDQPSPRVIYPVIPATQMSFVSTYDDKFDKSLLQYQKIVPYEAETTIADYYDFILNRVAVEAIRLRLENISRSSEPAWLNAGFSSDYFFGLSRIYSFVVTSSTGRELEAFAQLAEEVERIRQHGFTASEVQRTIDKWRVWLSTLDIEDQDIRSNSFADEYVRNFMYGEPVPGIINERVYIKDALDRMSAEQLHQEALDILRNDEGFVAVRAKQSMAAAGLNLQAFDSLLEKARATRLEPLEDRQTQVGLYDKLPPEGSIVSEEQLADGVTRLVLSNGAQVLLKPTGYDKDTVKFIGMAPGGWVHYPVELHSSLVLAANLFSAAGLGDMDALTLDTLTAPLNASVSWGIDEEVSILNGETTRTDLEALLRLVYLISAEPGKDEVGFNQLRQYWAGQMEAYVNDPDYRFGNDWNRHLYAGNPRLQPLSADTILSVDFTQTRSIILESFARAAEFTYLLAGDFNIEEIKPLLAKHLGAIPAGTGRSSNLIEPLRPRNDAAGRHDFAYAREDRATVRMIWSAEAAWSLEKQQTLDYLAAALNNRLLDALREDLGATYVVSVSASFNPSPVSQFALVVSFDTAPESVNRLVAEVDQEIQLLARDGLSDLYLQQIKAAASRSIQGRLNTNDFWLGRMLQALMYNTGYDIRTQEQASLNYISSGNFRSLAKEIFQPGQRFVYVLRPPLE
ncbi:MAG: insulinase family protein [Spirochaetes bacterium]|nr:insulinase family protein [Spirochaetota bacterium]MBU0955262.1 insulinase family protein [Spirochaetota bacterium]